MGDILRPIPVLPLLCAFSRDEVALDWAIKRGVERWGPVATASPRFDFLETSYYEATMGPSLKKCFWTFERLADPGELAAWKRMTNAWEDEYAAAHPGSAHRPLNLDPGYITPAKLVLASTKDHAHRMYLGDGIYAEITLMYRHGRWECTNGRFPTIAGPTIKRFSRRGERC
ncbi:MAG: DUF4416 family protein [Pirellulales bacterium]